VALKLSRIVVPTQVSLTTERAFLRSYKAFDTPKINPELLQMNKPDLLPAVKGEAFKRKK
jgi:hypothetical protein